jgi:hypothetical protein
MACLPFTAGKLDTLAKPYQPLEVCQLDRGEWNFLVVGLHGLDITADHFRNVVKSFHLI